MRQEDFPCGKHCDASLDKIALGLGGRELEIDALGKGAGTRAYAPASCTAPRSSNTDAFRRRRCQPDSEPLIDTGP